MGWVQGQAVDVAEGGGRQDQFQGFQEGKDLGLSGVAQVKAEHAAESKSGK
jgi:hypothetical protein